MHKGSIILYLILIPYFSFSQKTTIERSGDIFQLALPAAAIGSAFIWKDDQKPVKQVFLTMGLSLILTQSTKVLINKDRPLGGGKAFPSGHTSSAFTGAAFLERRYGWKVGVPSYILASYVAWTRIDAQKHDYWDLLGGAVVGIGSAYLFTKPYQKNKKAKLGVSTISNGHFLMNMKYAF